MSIMQFVFYAFATVLVFSSVMVALARNPVHGALFLVLGFFSAAGIWMMMEAEFLSLVLIIVYVGAVMTLFLFVVMMMNLDLSQLKKSMRQYLPLGGVIVALMLGLMWLVVEPQHFGLKLTLPAAHAADYSNIKAIGAVLYTQYVYAFELAAVLLLVAIVAAICLAHRGPQQRKVQVVGEQLAVRREDRVEVLKMDPCKRPGHSEDGEDIS